VSEAGGLLESLSVLSRKSQSAGRLLRFVLPTHRSLAYVGWLSHSNLGDEAMFQAYRSAFPEFRFLEPPSRREIDLLDKLARKKPLRGVMLGGGTLIGWPGYRRTLERLLFRYSDLPAFMLGTGVEDPTSYHRYRALVRSLAEADESDSDSHPKTKDDLLERELERWVPLFQRFTKVTVRGDRSREILRSFGVESEAVGDPALLLADVVPQDPRPSRVLGLNIGVSNMQWSSDPNAYLNEIVRFGRVMIERGWKIRVFPVWNKDLPMTRQVIDGLGSKAEVFEDFLDLEKFLAALRSCRVFVGQKLHSVVLAACVHVPSVMLAYHPKCVEFQHSIGRGDFTVATEGLKAEDVLAKAEDLAENYETQRALLSAAVISRQRQLRKSAAAISAWLARNGIA
jgi:hypothetical protein